MYAIECLVLIVYFHALLVQVKPILRTLTSSKNCMFYPSTIRKKLVGFELKANTIDGICNNLANFGCQCPPISSSAGSVRLWPLFMVSRFLVSLTPIFAVVLIVASLTLVVRFCGPLCTSFQSGNICDTRFRLTLQLVDRTSSHEDSTT